MAKIIAALNSDFGVTGYLDADLILDAIRKGEATMRDIIISRAVEYSPDAQHTADWLAGLADGFIKGGMAKGVAANRKSEAAAVFSAYYIMLKNIKREDAETDEAYNIRAESEAEQQIQAIDGGYHALVAKCREIVNAATGKAATTKTSSVKKISDAEKPKLVKRLLEADNSPSTCLELMTAAQTAFIKAAGTPDGIVRRIDQFAIALMRSSDKYYSTIGERFSKLAQEAIDHAATEAARHAEEMARLQQKLEAAAVPPAKQENTQHAIAG